MKQEQTRNHLPGFDPRPIFESTPGFQEGEAELVIGGEVRQVLGRMAACFLRFRSSDGLMYFQGVTVITPPQLIWGHSDQDIHEMLIKGIEDIHESSLAKEAIDRLIKRVTIYRCQQLNTYEVAAAIEAAGNRQVILIADCSKYRDPELQQEWSLGRSGSALHEDIWVPHAAQLALICTGAAKARGSVVVLSATEEAIVKQENIQLLTQIDLLYPVVLGFEGEADAVDLMSKQVPRWVALAAGGRADQAFEELENAGLSSAIKRKVALQVAARADDRTKVLTYLQEYLAEIERLSSDTLAHLGRLAHMHGDKGKARLFFDACIDKLSDQMQLEVSLLTVTSIGAADLVDRCWARLQTLFPHSKIIQENCEFRLLKICNTTSPLGDAAPSRVGFQEFHIYIADTLLPGAEVDYAAIVEQTQRHWPSRVSLAAICNALHAIGQDDLQSTIQYAALAAEDATYEPQAARVLLAALRRQFLLEVRLTEDMNVYKLPLSFILRYLGRHPEDAKLRSGLASALSVESAGAVGLPVLASFALDVIAPGIKLQQDNSKAAQPAGDNEFKVFFDRALSWMKEQPAIELGVTRLPPEIVGENAIGLIAALERLMRYTARRQDTPEDLSVLEKCAYLVCLLRPYAPEISSDLSALRLFAAKLWLQGQPQRARDLAEQMLALAGNSCQRQRLAWGNYADIFQRVRSPVDALIGLTCAALTGAQLAPANLFQEAYTLVRIARDLHLYDIARAILPTCRRLYEIQDLGDMGRQRLDGIEIALDVAQSTELSKAELLALLERAQAHCNEVMQGHDELFPAASLYLQVAGTLERTGISLPPAALAFREAVIQRLGTDTSRFLNAISSPFPKINEVVWLYNRLGDTTSAEDVPADQLYVVMAAHRLLLPRTPDMSVEEAAVAIELLSDRSVDRSQLATTLNIQWPAQFIQNLSLQGLGILLIAMDSNGETVAVLAEQGEVRIVRPATMKRSFRDRLDIWTATYPYRYGLISREDGNGEFYASMQELELPLPRTDNVLVIAQPALQQIAFNLVLINGEFAGTSKAIGLAPSLTWFDSARQRSATTRHRRHAWISCSPESDAYRTLEILFYRLAPVFDQYGFNTDTSGRIPSNLGEAGMAVVTAHGKLTFEERYIHSIADDQNYTESPLALARALAGVELVILFVCSGGRVDSHPLVNTTVSLPKMLIEHGCRVVIASPWPLLHQVPGHWLERFLDAWEAGDTVLEANFKANCHVEQMLGPEPNMSLAMTVYGDLLLKR